MTAIARSLHDRFMEFHTANPVVYKLFARFAREARAAGLDRYSAKAIMERLRWEIRISLRENNSSYKINNDYVARYARMLAQDDPSFANFFEFRALKRS